MQKIYVIFDAYEGANTKIAFANRADAEEFLLSVAEENAFKWFCDYLYSDYWNLGTPEAVFTQWKQEQNEYGYTNYSTTCYALLNGLEDFVINEVEVF